VTLEHLHSWKRRNIIIIIIIIIITIYLLIYLFICLFIYLITNLLSPYFMKLYSYSQ